MKRATRPFVVEVRRGPKKTPIIEPEQPVADPLRDDALRRAEAALFDGRPPESDAARKDAAEPQRRILQNLAEVDPLQSLLADETPPPRRGRKPGSKNKPKLPLTELPSEQPTLARRLELTPEVVSAAMQSMARATPPIERPMAEMAPPVAPAVGAARQRGEETHELTVAFAPPEAPPAPHAIAAPRPVPSATAARRAPRAHSMIMDVYVFKTEPKPWELWKHRLRALAR